MSSEGFESDKERGQTIHSERVESVLSTADFEARQMSLEGCQSEWVERIEKLRLDKCPRTYVGVLGVVLIARSLFESDVLDVRHIQQQTSSKGYAAPTIGKRLTAFAKEQDIDLRSDHIMNNSPFYNQPIIGPELRVAPGKRDHFANLLSAIELVNGLSSEEAREALSILFLVCRKRNDGGRRNEIEIRGGLKRRSDVIEATCAFVEQYSENGGVGQAMMAATLDVLYGEACVVMGGIHDPDVKEPGDVLVSEHDANFLFAESKQRVVDTGDVKADLEKVLKAGVSRVCYGAFVNHRYPRNLDEGTIQRFATEAALEVEIFTHPKDFLITKMRHAPGTFDSQSSILVNRFVEHLREARVSQGLIDAYLTTISD